MSGNLRTRSPEGAAWSDEQQKVLLPMNWEEENNLVFRYKPDDLISQWEMPEADEQLQLTHPERNGRWCWCFAFCGAEGCMRMLMFSSATDSQFSPKIQGTSSIEFIANAEGFILYPHRVKDILKYFHTTHPYYAEVAGRKIQID